MAIPEPPTSGLRPLAERANLCAGLELLPACCARFITDHEDAFLTAPGSGHNHQVWLGGYADHLDEVFAIAAVLYRALAQLRPLPFRLEDALLVLFLHDTEKMFNRLPAETPRDSAYEAFSQYDLQNQIIHDYELKLTPAQHNALTYIHGEGADYSGQLRAAGELASFVHDCDYWSARGWYDQPQRSGYLPNMFLTPAPGRPGIVS